MDVFGHALTDFLDGNYTEDIVTVSSLGEKAVLPLPYLFRNFDEMPSLERNALDQCRGSILDIGSGAGGHSLWLQQRGMDVTALDSSRGAVAVCGKRGIKKTVHSAILDFQVGKFDTLLLLMNGIGIAGTLDRLAPLLTHLKKLLAPGGQILLDSTEIIYMYDLDDDGGYWVPGDLGYYGEVRFQMQYKKIASDPFDWLYVDFKTLREHAQMAGLNCELIAEGEHYDYLAKLSPNKY